MRTTVNLDNDVYQAISNLSESSGVAMGKVLSEVARRGLKPTPLKKNKKGLPTFDVPLDSSIIPGMLAHKLQAEEDIG